MKPTLKSPLIALTLIALLLNACGVKYTPTTVPLPLPTDVPVQPAATEPPAEPEHEIYAGFTENEAMPFLMVHQSGESFVITQDAATSTVTGGVWHGADGTSFVFYSDAEGKPTSAVVGDAMVFFTNYTDQTVDVTVALPDGTTTTIQAPLDTEMLNKITSFAPPRDRFASHTSSDFRRQAQLDKWFWMKTGLYMIGVAGCVSGTAAALTAVAPVALPFLFSLSGMCTGALLGTVSRVGTIFGMDVSFVDSMSNDNSGIECTQAAGEAITGRIPSDGVLDCAELMLDWAEEDEKYAVQVKENPKYSGLQLGTIEFDRPTLKPGTYPISVPYSMILQGWSITLDYVEVLENGNLKIVNLWVNNNTDCGHQGDCDLWCGAQNDDNLARMLLPDGTVATALETNCTAARGQGWIVNPGETFSDWAVFPPLPDAAMPFSIDWYGQANAADIKIPGY